MISVRSEVQIFPGPPSIAYLGLTEKSQQENLNFERNAEGQNLGLTEKSQQENLNSERNAEGQNLGLTEKSQQENLKAQIKPVYNQKGELFSGFWFLINSRIF